MRDCSSKIAAPKAGRVSMELNRPLVIYSRKDLNAMLLNRAEAAGAEIAQTRILGLDRTGSGGWNVRPKRAKCGECAAMARQADRATCWSSLITWT